MRVSDSTQRPALIRSRPSRVSRMSLASAVPLPDIPRFAATGLLKATLDKETLFCRSSMWGPTLPELTEALPGVENIERSFINAWDEPRIRDAVTRTGRRKLLSLPSARVYSSRRRR